MSDLEEIALCTNQSNFDFTSYRPLLCRDKLKQIKRNHKDIESDESNLEVISKIVLK